MAFIKQSLESKAIAPSLLTSCCLYFYLNQVFLTIVHKGNSVVLLLDAIDSDSRRAVPRADLYHGDVVEGFTVPVM
jgi:hypothetical protein